jgi:DNA-binding SARP family transcriptional activator
MYSRLRRQLAKLDPSVGARLVTQRGCGYGIKVGEDETDLMRFRKLATRGTRALREGDADAAANTLGDALLLWRGPVGQGCTASGQLRTRFQAWDEFCLAVRERYLHARIVQGHSTDLMPELHAIISAAPFREASWANLIRAVYLSGDVLGALSAWQRVTTMLAEELGVDPSANLGDLHIAVLRRDDDAVRAYVHPAVIGTERDHTGPTDG